MKSYEQFFDIPRKCETYGICHLFYPIAIHHIHDQFVTSIKVYHTTKTIFGKDQRIYFIFGREYVRYALYPAMTVYLIDACVSQHIFPSCAVTLEYFPHNRGTFECVVFAFNAFF